MGEKLEGDMGKSTAEESVLTKSREDYLLEVSLKEVSEARELILKRTDKNDPGEGKSLGVPFDGAVALLGHSSLKKLF